MQAHNQFKLKPKYCQARELQKKITVSIAQLESIHLQCAADISKFVQEKIQDIKKYEQLILKEMQQAKSNCLSKVRQDFDQFHQYAIQIRKVYLGGNVQEKIPSYNLNKIRQHLQQIETMQRKLHSYVKRTNQHLTNSEYYFQSDAGNQPELFLVPNTKSQMQEPSFQVSPIKRKDYKIQQKEYNLSRYEASIIKQPINRELMKSLIEQNDQIVNTNRNCGENNRKQYLGSSIMKKQVPSIKIVQSCNKLQVLYTSQQREQQSIKRDKLQSLNSIRSNQAKLSKVRSQQKFDCGYKNCLKILQGQQLKYDRIKQGIN